MLEGHFGKEDDEEHGGAGEGEHGEGETPRCFDHRRRRHSTSEIDDYEGLRLLRQKRAWRSSSVSYSKLAESTLRLSILKLDGSSFDVEVGRSGTVTELRAAVEEVFQRSLKERENKISWSHVWSNFCLCYGHYKLVDGSATLSAYGIKEGDELHFARHLSINYSPLRRLSSRKLEGDYLNPVMSLAELELDQIGEGDYDAIGNKFSLGTINGDVHCKKLEVLHHTELRLERILRSWLSYSTLWCTWRSKSQPMVQQSRLGNFIARELEKNRLADEVSEKRIPL